LCVYPKITGSQRLKEKPEHLQIGQQAISPSLEQRNRQRRIRQMALRGSYLTNARARGRLPRRKFINNHQPAHRIKVWAGYNLPTGSVMSRIGGGLIDYGLHARRLCSDLSVSVQEATNTPRIVPNPRCRSQLNIYDGIDISAVGHERPIEGATQVARPSATQNRLKVLLEPHGPRRNVLARLSAQNRRY